MRPGVGKRRDAETQAIYCKQQREGEKEKRDGGRGEGNLHLVRAGEEAAHLFSNVKTRSDRASKAKAANGKKT